jgi:hypothetical protein
MIGGTSFLRSEDSMGGRIALFLVGLIAFCGSVLAQDVPGLEKTPEGIILPVKDGFLTIMARTDDIFRVTYSKDKAFWATKKSIMTVGTGGPTPHWDLTSDAGGVTI